MRKEPVAIRLWRNYEPEPNSGCWIWTAGIDAWGYGRINVETRNRLAHRIAYEDSVGHIPDGLLVLHRCDVPACINPAHLFLGTDTDNVADRNRKGRQMRYERAPTAKFTQALVREIRVSVAAGASRKALARYYHVKRDTIRNIVRGITWKGV